MRVVRARRVGCWQLDADRGVGAVGHGGAGGGGADGVHGAAAAAGRVRAVAAGADAAAGQVPAHQDALLLRLCQLLIHLIKSSSSFGIHFLINVQSALMYFQQLLTLEFRFKKMHLMKFNLI